MPSRLFTGMEHLLTVSLELRVLFNFLTLDAESPVLYHIYITVLVISGRLLALNTKPHLS